MRTEEEIREMLEKLTQVERFFDIFMTAPESNDEDYLKEIKEFREYVLKNTPVWIWPLGYNKIIGISLALRWVLDNEWDYLVKEL